MPDAITVTTSADVSPADAREPAVRFADLRVATGSSEERQVMVSVQGTQRWEQSVTITSVYIRIRHQLTNISINLQRKTLKTTEHSNSK